MVSLPWDGNERRQRNVSVSVLLAESFLGPRPPGMEPNHRDGDKANNRPGNLEWVTRSRNIEHAWEIGLRDAVNFARGTRHGLSKLTETDVLAIRVSTESQRALGRRFGVAHATIGMIKRRRTWAHL